MLDDRNDLSVRFEMNLKLLDRKPEYGIKRRIERNVLDLRTSGFNKVSTHQSDAAHKEKP